MNYQFDQVYAKLKRSYLSAASTVMFPADNSEGSLTGNAGIAGFIGDPVGRVCTEPKRNCKHKADLSPAECLLREGEKELADISKKKKKEICAGLFVDLLTFELALTGLGCQFR